MFRRTFLISALALVSPAFAQQQIFGRITQREAARGISEALGLAATRATSRLGQPNGFFSDPQVRIPLPQQFSGLQQRLRPFGLAGPLDDLELRINRAAEEAMPEAGRIFMSIIRSITIGDAVAIVRGGDNAATTFLRGRSEGRLITLLTPPMRRTLEESGAFRLLDSVAGQFSMRSMSRSVRGDVTDFAVGKALDGGFHYIAQEEAAIRRDPLRRSSDILRRVFR